MGTKSPPTRREQNRVRRRHEYLDVASRMVIREGFDGLTMQAIADEVGAAVGTIYTYFNSKSALVAELQSLAIGLLTQVADDAVRGWEPHLADLDERDRALTQLVAYGAFMAAVAQRYPDEYQLQQRLLMEPKDLVSDADAEMLLPLAAELAGRPQAMVQAAMDVGVISTDADAFSRSTVWVASFNGVMLLDGLRRFEIPGLEASKMCRDLTTDLLRGWSADADALARAQARADLLSGASEFVPQVMRWTDQPVVDPINVDDAATVTLSETASNAAGTTATSGVSAAVSSL